MSPAVENNWKWTKGGLGDYVEVNCFDRLEN